MGKALKVEKTKQRKVKTKRKLKPSENENEIKKPRLIDPVAGVPRLIDPVATAVEDKNEEVTDETSKDVDKCAFILERLAGDEAWNAIRDISNCVDGEGEKDFVQDFLAGGGTAELLLAPLTLEDKVKAVDVAAMFNAVETVVLRVVRDLPQYHALAMDLVRQVLTDHAKRLVLLISGTNTAYQAKSVLRMLTAFVTLGPLAAREVLVKLNWEHNNWETLPKRSSMRDTPDVRTCFAHFLLAFLVDPHPGVLKEFVNRKTRLASLFPGLMWDHSETVQLILETLRTNVLENAIVSRTIKMKLFGSHNLRPLLGLFKWKGPKKGDDEEKDEEKELELNEVQESVGTFLRSLLASQKYGVIFQDPDVGCGEKNLNPLVGEVLKCIQKPWETPFLSQLVSDILSACPDQVAAVFSSLAPHWAPRESQAWQLLADFLLSIVAKQKTRAFGSNMTGADSKVVKTIVEKVVLNVGLIEDVVKVGVSDKNPQVSRKCVEILKVLCKNAENFVKEINDETKTNVILEVFQEVVEKHFPKADILVSIWKEELECFVNDTENYALETLEILSFCNKWSKGMVINMEDIISQIEKASLNLPSEKIGKIQLEALRLFVSVTKVSGLNSRNFLQKVCTKETFRLLLNLSCSGDEEKVSISRDVLETVLKQGGVLKNDTVELDVLLAHISNGFSEDEVLDAVSQCIADVVENAEAVNEKITILSEKFENGDLDKHDNETGIEKLFEALMSPDFNEGQIEGWLLAEDGNSREPLCSPLIFSLLKKSVDCQSKSFTKLIESCSQTVIYFKDQPSPFCQLLLQKFQHLDPKLVAYVGSIQKSADFRRDCFKEFTTLDPTVSNKTLVESQALKMLLHLQLGCEESGPNLVNFITSILPQHQRAIVQLILGKKYLHSSFDPFAFNAVMTLTGHLLNLAKQLDVSVEMYKSSFLGQVSTKIAELIASDKHVSGQPNSIESWFRLLKLSKEELLPLLKCLVESSVGMLKVGNKATQLAHILDGVLAAMSITEGAELQVIEDSVALKLGCLVEILIDSAVTVGETRHFSSNFAQFLENVPRLCGLMSENLLLVCCKDNENTLNLVKVLVKHSDKHVIAFKSWIVDNKGFNWDMFLSAIVSLFESNYKDIVVGDKKFIFKLIKRDFDELVKFLKVKGDVNDMANVENNISFKYFKYLCDASRSSKQAEVWVNILQSIKSDDNDENIDAPKSGAIELMCKFEVLKAVQRISGGVDDQIAKELLIPLLHLIGWNLKSLKDGENESNHFKTTEHLCSLANQMQTVADNKVIVQHLENKNDLWSQFVRWILKYSLKKPDMGPPALDLLSSLASLKFKDSDGTEAKLLVTMIQQHSQYLPTLLGKPSPLKTSLVCLLESVANVCPQTCSIDQVPLLLSAYTATLSPADTALLSLLASHETAGLDLHQYKPFLFSTAAVNHFSIHKKAAGLWKMPKTSEVLSLLNPEMMTTTALQFPLSLPLSPHVPSTPSPSLYDPRFLLPLLSHLTSPGVYMDRHLKLVESGALGLAIAALSSRQALMRSAGYHLLHRIHIQMTSAKMAAEKQVWLHLLGLIKNGVAAAKSSKSCIRLPSLVTVFLVRSVQVLLTPLHPMYRAITGFFLAKPALDLYNIPEFLRLLHSREVNSEVEQRWILELVRDGLRDSLDYKLCSKNYVLKLLLSQWNCCLLSQPLQLLLLEVVEAMAGMEGPAADMVKGQGLVSWLVVVLEGQDVQEEVVERVLRIVRKLWKLEGVRDEVMVVVRKIGMVRDSVDQLVNRLNSSCL